MTDPREITACVAFLIVLGTCLLLISNADAINAAIIEAIR